MHHLREHDDVQDDSVGVKGTFARDVQAIRMTVQIPALPGVPGKLVSSLETEGARYAGAKSGHDGDATGRQGLVLRSDSDLQRKPLVGSRCAQLPSQRRTQGR